MGSANNMTPETWAGITTWELYSNRSVLREQHGYVMDAYEDLPDELNVPKAPKDGSCGDVPVGNAPPHEEERVNDAEKPVLLVAGWKPSDTRVV